MKKAAIQIVLALVVIGLAFVVYRQLTIPLQFDKEVEKRSAAVIDRIKDIRSAERAYKQVYNKYCGNFDSLIAFVLTDSMVYERSFGSADDSVAVARGLVKSEQFKMAVIDTAFGTKKLTPEQVQQLRYIPYSADQEYILEAGALETESGVTVQVFECRAPFKAYLSDLNHQELVNLIDERENTFKDYPGIKVGSMTSATNDAGNWE
ncbi:MAG TPA: hypothetical protein H9816_00375 [Candidatus Tidjanibacter faecipullorum]|uniref:Uncharacterized protein n=1 Tax=Candidatus Tidjanibacter faecipullorum TaxID=2838766 RepID=A0A9D2DCD8_9BACT|nr:hypothetical protein [Candidatus Tidjanibacter faecipullorum]